MTQLLEEAFREAQRFSWNRHHQPQNQSSRKSVDGIGRKSPVPFTEFFSTEFFQGIC
jgi:hypothetical protein